MNENKRLKVWIVILSCLLVLFGGYLFYLEYNKGVDTKLDNSNNSEVEKENNSDTDKSIDTGDKIEETEKNLGNFSSYENKYYSASENVIKDGESLVNWIDLMLYSDGLFELIFGYDVPRGYIGNYIIKDDQIILNYLFSTGSDTSLNPVKGSAVLQVKEDELIINDASVLSDYGWTGEELKLQEQISKQCGTCYGVHNIINSYVID